MTNSSANPSVLVSTFGTAVTTNKIDFAGAATALGLTIEELLPEGAEGIPAVLDAHDGAKSKMLLGTHDMSFDAACAAALGVPVVLVGPTPKGVSQMSVVFADAGATVLPACCQESLVDSLESALKEADSIEPLIGPDVFEHWLMTQAKAKPRHIVLPEGEDDRILEAASILLNRDVCELTILGDPEAMTARAHELGMDISLAHLVNPVGSPLAEEFAQDFYELRKAKGMTLEGARETMKDISYFATMMVHKGLADGMVSGAAHTTAHTIKPSFQIIKTKPGVKVVSSLFLMVLPGKVWGFGDCAVNPNPTAEQLAEIAVVSAQTAAAFGMDPKVALLSYSTGTSGHGPDVDRSVAAAAAAREMDPTVVIDGPLQFDSAVDEGVAKKKAPESPVAGKANVMIFPDLEAGNICYKAVQRTSGALAVGPILQGLNKPVNDLSRGATVKDIVNTVAITAIQAQGE